MKTRSVLVIFFIVFSFWFFSFIDEIGDDDTAFLKVLDALSVSTPYMLVSEEQEGVLGEFFTCIEGYKAIGRMAPKSGDISHVKIRVLESTYLYLSVIKGEAFRFYIFDEDSGFESDSYAINCDLSLLKSDKP